MSEESDTPVAEQSDTPLPEQGDQLLTPKQHGALIALLSELSIVKAAEKAGVGFSTLRGWLWLKEPEFRDAFSDACGRVVDATINQIQDSLSAALTTLGKDLASTDFEQRFRTACKLLDVGIQGITLGHLARRIRALENASTPGTTPTPTCPTERETPS